MERPILFSAPMVNAILEGRKTMTRRVVKPQPDEDGLAFDLERGQRMDTSERVYKCPYGKPGDTLWVRETFSGPYVMTGVPPSQWVDGLLMPDIWYWADGDPKEGDWTIPKPSIHMPRFASRLTLKITDIRVERLQDISEEDAKAEGVPPNWCGLLTEGDGSTMKWSPEKHGFLEQPCDLPDEDDYYFADARTAFKSLWDSINGKPRNDGVDISWQANPWLWIVEFERVEGNHVR